jgi:hypothetical protein
VYAVARRSTRFKIPRSPVESLETYHGGLISFGPGASATCPERMVAYRYQSVHKDRSGRAPLGASVADPVAKIAAISCALSGS